MPTPKKTYSGPQLATAKELLIAGAGREKLKSAGISEDDARMLKRISGQSIAEFNAELQETMKLALSKLARRIADNVDELPLTALGINFGILHDKLGASGAPVIQNQTNIQINGNVGREDVIGMLTGAKGATKQPMAYPEHEPVEVLCAEGSLPRPPRVGEISPPGPASSRPATPETPATDV